MLDNSKVFIVSPRTAKSLTVHLKFTHCYMSNIFQFLKIAKMKTKNSTNSPMWKAKLNTKNNTIILKRRQEKKKNKE